MDGECREVVSSDVPVQVYPVGKTFSFRGKACFFQEGGKQAVGVVLQEYVDVQVARALEGAVQQSDLVQGEGVRVELVLGGGGCKEGYQREQQG